MRGGERNKQQNDSVFLSYVIYHCDPAVLDIMTIQRNLEEIFFS